MGEYLAGTDWGGLNYLWRIVPTEHDDIDLPSSPGVKDVEDDQSIRKRYEFCLEEVKWNKNPNPTKQRGKCSIEQN